MPRSFVQELQADLDARLNELNRIRIHVGSLSSTDPVKADLAAMLIVRIYAAMEGAVKTFVNLYIQAHASGLTSVAVLRPEFLTWRYEHEIRRHIANLGAGGLMAIDSSVSALLHAVSVPKEIEVTKEYTTMNCRALRTVLSGCGLDTTFVDQHSTSIDQLCRRRHDVAHGRVLSQTTIQGYVQHADDAKSLVTNLLYELAYQILKGLQHYSLRALPRTNGLGALPTSSIPLGLSRRLAAHLPLVP